MDLGLNGRSVLITGASKGIGAATAMAFAREGAGHIHINARNAEGLEATKQAIRAHHNVAITCHPVDISARGGCERLAEAVGDVDILVNNAGAIPPGNIAEVDEERWRQAWDLKVFGYVNLTRIYYGRMAARGRGVIVNDIGNAGARPTAGYVAGSAGNASLMAFTNAMGGASMDKGVRVVAVNPGPVMTDRLVRSLQYQAKVRLGSEDRWAELIRQMPGGRAATADEIADAIVFLASDRSGYTSGAVLIIDGGAMHRG